MPRIRALLVVLLAPLVASCLSSPASPGDAPAIVTATDATVAAGKLDQGGGILIRSELGRWCSCDAGSFTPGMRLGVGIRFTWTVADPVAADRFATFRALVDGEEVSKWGDTREWPPAPASWFPDAGMHTFTVEKDLNGVVTSLDATFEVVAR
jgi:hypothetical protein